MNLFEPKNKVHKHNPAGNAAIFDHLVLYAMHYGVSVFIFPFHWCKFETCILWTIIDLTVKK